MIYARSKNGEPNKQRWQSLEDHLNEVSKTSEIFATKLDSAEIAKMAGYLHDLGKIATEFQRYLEQATLSQDENKRFHCSVNHSEAGAAWAVERFKNITNGSFWGTTLAYVIAGHHAGLPDYNSDGRASLNCRLDQGKKNLSTIQHQINVFLPPLEMSASAIERVSSQCKRVHEPKDYHLWVRFLFSALVDADRLDAEKFDQPELASLRGSFASLKELKECYDQYMKKRFQYSPNKVETSEEARLKKLRNDVLSACRRAGKEESSSSLFTLTVPTGGGKTLASMAFALEHAVSHNLDRIIYVIPYTSIIEQTAEVFRSIFGLENVVEHHSNFDENRLSKESSDPDNESTTPILQKMNQATENWDAPIIVTTNVQFFESLYSAKPSRCRKLHRIANSVVILDEVQLLNPELLSPCVDVLNRLSKNYRTTILLSTATQPAKTWTKLKKLGYNTNPENLLEPKAIIPEPSRLYYDLARVRYDFDNCGSSLSWESIADQLEEFDEVLCVVNTRRDCRELFDILKERENNRLDKQKEASFPETIHLSALMCGEHRSRIISSIRERLGRNATTQTKKPLRVVSTQLIEAGVDLDFPVVYRALAGLDSIIQAAGRCNREGRLGLRGGLVRVFTPPKPAPLGLLRKGADSTSELLRQADFDMNLLETFDKYFSLFYGKLNTLDEKNVIERLSKNVTGNSFEAPFRTVGEDFKLIEDDCYCPILVQYGEGTELIEQFRQGHVNSKSFRRLQRFSVNIPRNELSRLVGEGKIEEILPNLFAQTVPGLYNESTGFDLFRKGFMGLDFYV